MLAIVYLFQIGGSIVSSALVAKHGLVKINSVGAFLLTFICIGSIFSAWKASLSSKSELNFIQSAFTNTGVVVTVMFVASALSGFGQALVTVVEGEYIALCATESTKGFYYGYSWCIYMQS
jgi:hypothetical protein